MVAPTQLLCYGGPLDGETVEERGFLFTHLASVRAVADGVLATPGFQSGVYRRTARGYEWVTP